jgi:predicted N-acetyltransferase YhbS
MAATIRPMQPADAAAAARLWATAWSGLEAALREEPRAFDGMALGRLAARYRYLLGTDPGGSFVAEGGEAIVGIAASHVRAGRFLLANLGVAPSVQGKGIGRALLADALEHGAGAPVGLICSSPDPRALHRYLRAGFRLSPAMEAIGRPSPEVRVPATVRRGAGAPGDLDMVDALDQHVRHAARRADVWSFWRAGPSCGSMTRARMPLPEPATS